MSAGSIRRIGATAAAGKSVSSLLRSAAAAKHHGRTPSSAFFSSASSFDSFSAAPIADHATPPANRLCGNGGNPNFGDGGGDGDEVVFGPEAAKRAKNTISNISVRDLPDLCNRSRESRSSPEGTGGVVGAGASSSSSSSNNNKTSAGGGGGGFGPLSGARRTVSSLLSPATASSPRSSSAPAAVSASGAPVATRVDVVVIGGGQAGLSSTYYLQRAGGLRLVTLDSNQEPGGAWRHRWPSLKLFSTRKWSSLPGYPMFANGSCEDGYPSTGEMAMYMEEYEEIMKLNVVRPVVVTGVTRTTMGTFLVDTDCLLGGSPNRWEARAVISAAGSHKSPDWPRLPGAETFKGVQIHSSQYRSAEDFRGARVAVVGSGNSGAQILAEVSQPGIAASTLWSTSEEPSFLPVGFSGKDIFDSVARIRQQQGFVREEDIPSLSSVIMQPGVVEAAERGVYDHRVPAFKRLTPTGVAWDVPHCSPSSQTPPVNDDGGVTSAEEAEAEVDVIIWCTGYRANTSHLSRLGVVREDSTVAMDPRDVGETDVPGVFAVGYGHWAGIGSGSIPGSTFYAKRAATAALNHLRGRQAYSPLLSSHPARQNNNHGNFKHQLTARRALPFAGAGAGSSSAFETGRSVSLPSAHLSSAAVGSTSTPF